MSKLNNLFNEAKKNKKKIFIGFVTSGDPDYKSSKEIIKEMTKSCQIIEVGISFNTSTSDSPIIMEANDRAINSGMNMNKTFKLIKEVKRETKTNTCFVIMTYLNPVKIFGLKKFINQCSFVGIDGVIIVDSNLNSPEEKILINGLSKNKIGYIKIISPANDDEFIKQSIKNCRDSWLYITSYFGLTGSKNVNINNVKIMIKRVKKYSKEIPVAVGFGVKTPSQVKQVSRYADGVICGSTIVNKVAEGHKKRLKSKKLATFVSSYVKKLVKGVKK